MALKQQPTLGEMTSEVLAGLNMGAQGALTAELHPLIARNLRDAQAYLWSEYRWLQNRTGVEVELTADETDYDIPDDFDPGSIRNIYCRSNRSSETTEWDLAAGIETRDRNMVIAEPSGDGIPYAYDIVDQVIRVHPAPRGDDPPTMVIEMDTGLSPLTEDEQRPSVDGRAMVMLATITTKESRRIPVGATEKAMLDRYVASQRSKQRPGRIFTIGTDYRHPMDPRPSLRTPYNRDDWRPSASP
jgi:hypothetical protein